MLMSGEEKEILQKDASDILNRREALMKMLMGSLALSSIAPILAIARGTAPQTGEYCIKIENVEEQEWNTNRLYVTNVKLYVNGVPDRDIEVYALRGNFTDVFAPSLTIARKEGKPTQVFAYATDLEFSIFETGRTDFEEIIEEAIERAKQEKKLKVARYMAIIKETRRNGRRGRSEKPQPL